MKKIACLTMLAVIMMVTGGQAVTITTSSKTGNYFKVGQKLSAAIGGKNTVIKSKGSVENLEFLMDGTAQVGIVQMDAYAWYLKKHPKAATTLEILGELYQECAYLAVQCDGKVKNEDDLQFVKNATIAVGKKGTGSSVTWGYMLQLEPKYKNAQVSFSGGTRALSKLAAKQLDAVMWVTAPRIDGKMASTVMKNKELCLVGFNDKDLNDKLPATGKPVYRFQNIEIKKGFLNDKEFTTACVDTVIVAHVDTDEDILEAISDTLLNDKSTLIEGK